MDLSNNLHLRLLLLFATLLSIHLTSQSASEMLECSTNILLIFSAVDCTLDVTTPKNFTRSRYSLRNRSNIETNTTINTAQSIATSPASATITLPIEEFLNVTERWGASVKAECGVRVGENHPWIAVLEHTDPTGRSRKKTLSKGVLIDERHVLTTVSSVHNSHPFWTV